MALHLNATCGVYRPSTHTSSGSMPSASTARRMASRLARRMLMRSISSTLAEAIAQASAHSLMRTASSSRTPPSSCFESASPWTGRAGSRTTAAAKTAPRSGPGPASSTPHSKTAVGSGVAVRGMVGSGFRKEGLERLDEALIMTFRERLVKGREARAKPLARGLVVEPVAHRLREVGGRGVVLEELGHDELAREDVGQARVGQQRLALHHPVGEGTQPVCDHHGAARKRRLERGGAARGERHPRRGARDAGIAGGGLGGALAGLAP